MKQQNKWCRKEFKMAVFQYNRDTLDRDKTSKVAIMINHQEIAPYTGRFNYFKQYTLPIFKSYSAHTSIDLILVTDFQFDKYQTSQPKVFGKRLSTKYLYALHHLLQKYDYITVFNSHSLLHKNMPSLYDVIDYSYDVIVPEKCYNPIYDSNLKQQSILYTLKYSAANPDYDKSFVHNYYKKNREQWWSGPHIIFNENMKQWFSVQKLLEFQMNDMIWHYVYNAIGGHQKYKMKIQPKLNMLSMNLFLIQILKNDGNHSLSKVMKSFQGNKYKVLQELETNNACISYFGGCGSYSSLWPLRPLMMKSLLESYRQQYFEKWT